MYMQCIICVSVFIVSVHHDNITCAIIIYYNILINVIEKVYIST